MVVVEEQKKTTKQKTMIMKKKREKMKNEENLIKVLKSFKNLINYYIHLYYPYHLLANRNNQLLTVPFLKAYITYAKEICHPTLTQEAADQIS